MVAALRRGSRSGFDQGSTRSSRVVAFWASRVVTFWASRVVTSSFLSLALRRCSFRRDFSPSDGSVRFDGARPRRAIIVTSMRA